MAIKLTDLLSESPATGYYLTAKNAAKLEALLKHQVNGGEFLGGVNVTKLGGNRVFAWGNIGGSLVSVWLGLFDVTGNEYVPMFGAVLNQLVPAMRGIPTYQVKFASKFGTSDKGLSKLAFVSFLKDEPATQLVSDGTLSDQAANSWLEIATDPKLKNQTFFWDIDKKCTVTINDPADLFGQDPKFQNVLCGLAGTNVK